MKISRIRFILKNHGLDKVIRKFYYMCYRCVKNINIDVSKENLLKINGYEMKTLAYDEGISRELSVSKVHEPLCTQIILNEVNNGDVCLDIGANIGYYALLENKLVGEKGKVIAIEPSPRNYNLLKENLKLQFQNNTDTFNFATGIQDGIVDFIITKESNWCKVKEKNSQVKKTDKLISVTIKNTDNFLEKNNYTKIDFIRMDVEGYEINILKGLVKTLEKFHPKMMIEVHYNFLKKDGILELIKFLKKYNYSIMYYIPRILDNPFVGNMNDIKEIDFDDLTDKLTNGSLAHYFNLFLEPKINL